MRDLRLQLRGLVWVATLCVAAPAWAQESAEPPKPAEPPAEAPDARGADARKAAPEAKERRGSRSDRPRERASGEARAERRREASSRRRPEGTRAEPPRERRVRVRATVAVIDPKADVKDIISQMRRRVRSDGARPAREGRMRRRAAERPGADPRRTRSGPLRRARPDRKHNRETPGKERVRPDAHHDPRGSMRELLRERWSPTRSTRPTRSRHDARRGDSR